MVITNNGSRSGRTCWGTGGREKISLTALLALCATSVMPAQAAGQQSTLVPSETARLRAYFDGAGPSAIFRFGRYQKDKADLFGVVDPVGWRIQFFKLRDADGTPLAKRMSRQGDCALDPRFRVWRVHTFDSRIVLQSQPDVTVDRLNSNSFFTHTKVVLETTQDSIDRFATTDPTPLSSVPKIQCGEGQVRTFNPAKDAANHVAGGAAQPFTVVRQQAATKAPRFLKLPIEVSLRGAYLSSVQELEDAVVVGEGYVRHMLVTFRTTDQKGKNLGFVASNVTLMRYREHGEAPSALTLNVGLTRIKTGQRFVAVSSKGEVILIGASSKDEFKFFSCQFQSTVRKTNAYCNAYDAAPHDTTPVSSGSSGEQENTSSREVPSRRILWENALWFSNYPFWIDTKVNGCPSPRGCTMKADGADWLPITEFRFPKGIVLRTGFPYAQRSGPYPRPRIPVPSGTPENPLPLRDETPGRKPYVFGDIKNAGLVDSSVVQVFGIDCSAYVSALWGLSKRYTTFDFIKLADREFTRLKEIGSLRMGDALVIRLAHTIEHIVIFREQRPAGPFDSSRAFLVSESSSSCGGVCWTFYDESFFHGWVPLRLGPPHTKSGFDDIETVYSLWKDRFAQ